jgi:RNA polymerase sigma-70 factor (ECF subfamily)
MQQGVDKILVLQFQSGDKKALAELVKRWHKQFCNKAYWLVKDKEVAKDIAQDSWNVIINKIDTLKDANSFGGWVMRIVCTKSLDWLRAKAKEQAQQNEYSYSQKTFDVVNEDNEQIKKALSNAIKSLPIKQLLVIKLFYVEGYSIKQIGDLLDISIGTTKSRLFHAREKLKLILKRTKNKY